MKKLLILAAVTFSLCTAQAELAPSHAAALDKMFTTMKLQDQYEASLIAGFESGIGISAEQIKALPKEQQDKFNAAMTKVQAKLMDLMGWDKMKGEMAQVYAKFFTEKEAQDVVTLLESPTGQMLVSKQVGLVSEAMKLTQNKMKDVLPMITQIIQEEMTK